MCKSISKQKVCMAVLLLGTCAIYEPTMARELDTKQLTGHTVGGVGQQSHSRNVYFGETHIHTSLSSDAFVFGVRATPEDAYRYAMGESIEHVSGVTVHARAPLDFIAVTDHSEFMGVMPTLNDPSSELSKSAHAADLSSSEPQKAIAAYAKLFYEGQAGQSSEEINGPSFRKSVWKDYVELADRYYQPGKFTTLIGFEWTGVPQHSQFRNLNLHRNVLFRSNNVPEMPFSVTDSNKPEDLWKWMDDVRKKGSDLLAIPHNSNVSNGLMFPLVNSEGRPIDENYATTRLRNEPVVEVTQIKGTSETHPSLSPNDEWAGFEILDELLVSDGEKGQAQGSYVRDAYLTGIRLHEEKGFNPYRFGLIGSSDSHNATTPVEEDNFTGKLGVADATPETRRKGSFVSKHNVYYSASGLAGVWAEQNTRESIFDAVKRKEVFATTGPRISVRFFGGWDFSQDLLENDNWVGLADSSGVPMGSDLPMRRKSNRAPSFIVWALKDPASAWLQRAQVVKGWLEDGEPKEQVFDVACSDNLSPDSHSHRCPDNGARVDLTTCEYSKTGGNTQLSTVWQDPNFDPTQRSFYYVRILENPTCRWSTWDSIRTGIQLSDLVPRTVQERAYTSPIWYNPTH